MRRETLNIHKHTKSTEQNSYQVQPFHPPQNKNPRRVPEPSSSNIHIINVTTAFFIKKQVPLFLKGHPYKTTCKSQDPLSHFKKKFQGIQIVSQSRVRRRTGAGWLGVVSCTKPVLTYQCDRQTKAYYVVRDWGSRVTVCPFPSHRKVLCMRVRVGEPKSGKLATKPPTPVSV